MDHLRRDTVVLHSVTHHKPSRHTAVAILVSQIGGTNAR